MQNVYIYSAIFRLVSLVVLGYFHFIHAKKHFHRDLNYTLMISIFVQLVADIIVLLMIYKIFNPKEKSIQNSFQIVLVCMYLLPYMLNIFVLYKLYKRFGLQVDTVMGKKISDKGLFYMYEQLSSEVPGFDGLKVFFDNLSKENSLRQDFYQMMGLSLYTILDLGAVSTEVVCLFLMKKK